jgi:integrase
MKSKLNSFDQLSFDAARFLIHKMGRTQETAKQYVCYWRRIKRYMAVNKIKQFDSSVGKKYLLSLFGSQDYSKLSKGQKDYVRSVRVLSEFSSKGSIRPVKEQVFFNGPIGEAMADYISYRFSLRLNIRTVEEGQQHLFRFYKYLITHGIKSVKHISHLHILTFAKTIDPIFTTLTYRALESIRGFFRYAYKEKLIEQDIAVRVPKYNYNRQPKLPSVYSPEEIDTMIASIDRGSVAGKRNYAIVLLAARLGLRASDIAYLKFENIYWDKSTIILNQFKTGKRIELPLLPDVGNAIIDYLKYGRPKSDHPFIFLIACSPFSPIMRGAITGIVHSYLMKAGIDITQRRHGPHALRHSLASILLEKETILPVISEVLGHQDTESTNYYLRIDRKSMSKCVLEVPPVTVSFYHQQKGYFYA